ncbi:MAG TPA: hypothetical protein DC054_26825 [Blastocatellia bacterium]|nr:hypothetical protein [Blastocatellia bacterium]
MRPTGCVLLIIAFNFAVFGLLFMSVAIRGWDWGPPAANVPLKPDTNIARATEVVLGLFCLLVAWVTSRLALKPDPKYQELGLNSFEKPEIYQEETRLNANQLKLLRDVKEKISNAPSQDEVLRILEFQSDGGVEVASSALQPIAFAIRRQPETRYWKGWTYEILTWSGGILLIPALLTLVIVLPSLLKLLILVFGIRAIIYVVPRLIHRARRYRLKPHKALERDARPPILYLRAFSDDFAESIEGYSASTAEERLVSAFACYGPPIAIGKPKEDLPTPGATRIYFEAETSWVAGVLYLMSISQLTVIQAGFAEGLLWEIGMARQRLEPHKLLISFHAWNEINENTRYLQYLRFKSLAEELLRCKLPDEITNGKYLFFNHNWEASWTDRLPLRQNL